MDVHTEKKDKTKTIISSDGDVIITMHGEMDIDMVVNFFIKTPVNRMKDTV